MKNENAVYVYIYLETIHSFIKYKKYMSELQNGK